MASTARPRVFIGAMKLQEARVLDASGLWAGQVYITSIASTNISASSNRLTTLVNTSKDSSSLIFLIIQIHTRLLFFTNFLRPISL
jgi:hypothetical protein